MDSNWDTIALWMHDHGDRLARTLTVMIGDTEDAQDIVQEVFIRAYRALDSYRGTGSPYTYLYSIALNLVRSQWRRRARRPRDVEYDDHASPGYYPGPESTALSNEQAEMVTKGVRKLSPKLREVVSLFYLSGMSVEDMGEVLGIRTGTVKSRLFRAREELKRYITEEVGYETV